MAKEKFRLMFNAKNGTLLGHLPKGMDTFGLDPAEVSVRTVQYDPDHEVFIGTYADGEVVKISDADKGKAFVFFPTAESSKACRGLMSELFQRVFGGDTMAFMSSFFETKKPTSAELQLMQQMIFS